MALKTKCYSPTCTSALSPFQDKCYSATCPDTERTLLASVEPVQRKTLIELREHQEHVIGQLESLQTSVENLKNTVRNNVKDEELLCTYQDTHEVPSKLIRDIVVMAPPSNLPVSVIVLKSLLQRRFKVKASVHVHSSVKQVDPKLTRLFQDNQSGVGSERRSNYDLALTLIWKETRFNRAHLVVNNQTPIIGEVNIARYVKRLLESGETCEDLSGAAAASVSDALMDSVSNLLERQGSANVEKEKTALVKSVAGRLSTQPWISSHKSLGVEDVLVWRSLNVRGKVPAMPKTVTDWLARCTGDPLFREAADLLK